MGEIKFVKCKDIRSLRDGTIDPDYGYAVCKCHLTTECIQVPRPENKRTIYFTCPRCGEPLTIHLLGKRQLKED